MYITKHFIYIVMVFFIGISSHAQTKTDIEKNYYLYLPNFENGNGSLQKTYFELAKDKIIVEFKSNISIQEKERLLSTYNLIGDMKNSKSNAKATLIAKINNQNISESEVEKLITNLNNEAILNYVSPFLISKDTYHGVTNDIMLKLKKSTTERDLLALIKKNELINLISNKYNKNLFTVNLKNVKSSLSIIEICNTLHESGLFDFVQPDFIRLIKLSTVNDPLFGNQWHLNNIGQYNGGLGEDIEAEAGWSINNGGSISTKIAIFDEGVELNHPDLPLVVGNEMVVDNNVDYESTYFGGGPAPGNHHGTYCAGVAAAKSNNSIGVTGIAHNSMIYSYRIAYKNPDGSGYWVTHDSWMTNAVYDAISSGVQVINMSFKMGATSALLSDAFADAITQGNALKGIFLVAATGNDNANLISYPASDTTVFAVGASSMCGERTSPSSCDGESHWGSNYGTQINVVAPGVKIMTTDLNGLYTIEGGTSLAAPVVAGIAALLMDSKPSDHVSEIQEYIESTCEEVGGYFYPFTGPSHPVKGWNEEMGYGRVNLKRALEEATGQTATGTATPPPTTPLAHQCLTAEFSYGTTVSVGTKTFYGSPSGYTYDSECYPWPGYNFVGPTDLRWKLYNISSGTPILVSTKHESNLSVNVPNLIAYTFDYNFTTVGEEYMLVLEAWDALQMLDDNGNTINYTSLNPNDKDYYSFYDAIDKTFTIANCNGFSIDASASGNQLTPTSFQICDEDPLELDVQVAGGIAPYTYDWYKVLGNTSILVASTDHPTLDNTVYQHDNNNIKVIVRDAQNCQQIKTLNVDVKHIEIDAPNQVIICRYDSGMVDITATGDAPFTYLWSPPHYNFLSSPTDEDAIIEIDPTLFGTSANFTVTVTDANGCENTATTMVKTVAPTSLPVDAGLDQTICTGGDIVLTAIPTSQDYSYQWFENGNTIIATTEIINVNPTSTTSYTLLIRDENNCPSTDEVVVTISPSLDPIVDLGADITLCPGLLFTVNPTITNSTNPIQYLWSDNSLSAVYPSSNMIDETISLIIIDANGCSATDEVSVIRDISLAPDVQLNWTNESTICPGEIANITTTVNGATAPYSYLWSNSDVTSSTTFGGSGNKSLTVTDVNGCITTEEIQIVIPSDWLSYNSGAVMEVCKGTEVNLSFVDTNGGYDLINGGTSPYQTYQWYPSMNVSNPNAITTTATPQQTTYYSLIVEDAHGCINTEGWHGQYIYKVIESVPEGNITYEVSPGCEDRYVCFNGNIDWGLTDMDFTNPYNSIDPNFNPWISSPDPLTSTVLWDFGANASPQTSTETNPCVQFTTSGNQTVNLTITNSCGTVTYSEIIYVPDYDFTSPPYNKSICGNVPQFHPFPFPATTQNIFPAQNNIYASDCGINVVAENTYVEYLAGNEIYLRAGFWAKNTSFKAHITSCISTGYNKLMSDDSIDEKVINVEYNIFPNPTSGEINIIFSESIENTQVLILNIVGNVIFSEKVITDRLAFDLSEYPKGVYLVKITSKGESKIEKIVYN